MRAQIPGYVASVYDDPPDRLFWVFAEAADFKVQGIRAVRAQPIMWTLSCVDALRARRAARAER